MHEQSEKFSKERILKKKKKQKFYLWEMQKLYWRIQKSFKSKLNYVEESAGNPEDNTVRGTKRKMSEESNKGLMRHNEKKQYLHYEDSRRTREREMNRKYI